MGGGWSSLGRLGLRRGDVTNFVVHGSCMPALEHGSSVQVRTRSFYLPGDIVVVRRNRHWNVHRLLGYAPSRAHGWVVLTQADNGRHPDPPSSAAMVTGQVLEEVTMRDRLLAIARYVKALWLRVGSVR